MAINLEVFRKAYMPLVYMHPLQRKRASLPGLCRRIGLGKWVCTRFLQASRKQSAEVQGKSSPSSTPVPAHHPWVVALWLLPQAPYMQQQEREHALELCGLVGRPQLGTQALLHICKTSNLWVQGGEVDLNWLPWIQKCPEKRTFKNFRSMQGIGSNQKKNCCNTAILYTAVQWVWRSVLLAASVPNSDS